MVDGIKKNCKKWLQKVRTLINNQVSEANGFWMNGSIRKPKAGSSYTNAGHKNIPEDLPFVVSVQKNF